MLGTRMRFACLTKSTFDVLKHIVLSAALGSLLNYVGSIPEISNCALKTLLERRHRRPAEHLLG